MIAAMCKPERMLPSEPDHAGTLIMNFQPSELLRNKFLLFMGYPVHGILLWQP